MSYLNWHAGMKVVCVDDKDAPELDAGSIYTIKEIRQTPGYSRRYGASAWGITLVEVAPIKHERFAYKRFRPVQTRNTSIEVFTRILRNPHVRIREDA